MNRRERGVFIQECNIEVYSDITNRKRASRKRNIEVKGKEGPSEVMGRKNLNKTHLVGIVWVREERYPPLKYAHFHTFLFLL